VLKQVSIVVLIFVLLGLAAYVAGTAYNPSADQEVVSSSFIYSGGAPEPGEICSYPNVPVVRVWGDGLAYYRETIPTSPSGLKSYWGRLSSGEIGGMIRGFWLLGLFTDFEVGAPNPAGNHHEFTVQLRWFAQSQDLDSGLSPRSGAHRSYRWLVEYLVGKLVVFEPGTSGEARIDRLNLDRECAVQPANP
jgi:hypothetical protein